MYQIKVSDGDCLLTKSLIEDFKANLWILLLLEGCGGFWSLLSKKSFKLLL